MAKPLSIIIHHELGSNGFYGVNEWHKTARDKYGNFRYHWGYPSSLGWFVGYQYYIDKSGKVWKAREDTEEGMHTIGRNKDSIGICLEGNLDIERPTPAQLDSLKKLILQKMTEWAIRPNQIFGHRIYAPKSCPGNLFPESEVRALFQPDMKYYQQLLNSISDWLRTLKVGRIGSVSSDDIHGRG